MILHSHGRAMRSPKSTLAMLAGIAFKVVLLAVFGLDEIFPGPAEQRVAASAAGQP